MARAPARTGRERPLGGTLRGVHARTLAVHDRGLGRPLRDAARRARPEARSRAERPEQRAERGRGSVRPRHGRRLARGRAQARREGPARQGVAPASPRGRRRAGARPLRSVVRALPAQLGRVQGRPEGAAAARRARLRRDLPAAHPSDRDDQPQGAEQRTRGREGRSGEPVGDRRAGGRPRCDPPRAGHAEGLRPARRGGAEARARDRARLRDPVLTRPPVAEGPSGVVQPAAGRDAEVRREPAQALPGHLQRQLRLRGLARPVGGAAGRRPPLVPPRRAGVSASTIRTRSRCRSGSG